MIDWLQRNAEFLVVAVLGATFVVYRLTGRLPWQRPVRYVVSVLALVDDGPPRVIRQEETWSLVSASEKAHRWHEAILREGAGARYAVNVQCNPQ